VVHGFSPLCCWCRQRAGGKSPSQRFRRDGPVEEKSIIHSAALAPGRDRLIVGHQVLDFVCLPRVALRPIAHLAPHETTSPAVCVDHDGCAASRPHAGVLVAAALALRGPIVIIRIITAILMPTARSVDEYVM